MSYRFSYRPYRRAFVRPLRTARGVWSVREGFIVRVESDAGTVGYGEVAPLPEFGSETLDEARGYLDGLVRVGDAWVDLAVVPGELPCCAFGVSSALRQLSGVEAVIEPMAVAGLLPAGEAMLELAVQRVAGGMRCLKWKVGVESVSVEQALFRRLDGLLPAGVRVRLDANCSWDVDTLRCWLEFLSGYRERVDYVEQPLAVGEESVMAALQASSGLPIALDESLQGEWGQRWLEPGAWAGPLVVKPLIMGDVGVLLERLRPVAAQVVFSSVFETRVGLGAVRRLLGELSGGGLAHGFDTGNMFHDELSWGREWLLLEERQEISGNCERLWHSL